MDVIITDAVKKQERARVLLVGRAGSGKTYTMLNVGQHMGARLGVIDSEHRSAALYADEFRFRHVDMVEPSVDNYIKAIKALEADGCDVIGIDSLSHPWEWLTAWVDAEAIRTNTRNTVSLWNRAGKKWKQLFDAILSSRAHIIATARAATEWSMGRDEQGKLVVEKLGTKPAIRRDFDFEFTVTGDLDHEHTLRIDKTRCRRLDRAVFELPGQEFAQILLDFLNAGEQNGAQEPTRRPPVNDAKPPVNKKTQPVNEARAGVNNAQSSVNAQDARETHAAVGAPAGEKAVNSFLFRVTSKTGPGWSVAQVKKLASAELGESWKSTATADQIAALEERIKNGGRDA